MSQQSSFRELPLGGIRVVLLALNVPGPVAAARLRELGASIVKVELPRGDPLQAIAPEWYAALNLGVDIRRLDLKEPTARANLDDLLASADLLITSFRPSSLERLGLDRNSLSARHPALCHVAIVGHGGSEAELAGHDLTYQARAGLLSPPALPATLLADLAGAERAVSASLALLLGRARNITTGFAEVSLADAVDEMAAPLRHGATKRGGPLGGANPNYQLYAASDGWIAVAALEPHFAQRLQSALGVERVTRETFATAFALRTANEWETWAGAHDLPIAAVRRVSGKPGDSDTTPTPTHEWYNPP